MNTPAYFQVSTTIDQKEKAQKLAEYIIIEKLGACVQIQGPIESCYWWENRIKTEQEWKLSIKTNAHACQKLINAIKVQHLYDVPEIIVLPIVDGNEDYLHWLDDTLS